MAQNTQRKTKAEQREEARAAALQARQAQAQRDKRNRIVAIGALVVAVVALVAVVIFILGSGPDRRNIAWQGDPNVTLAEATGPAAADDQGRIPVGPDLVAGTSAGAETTLEIVYDYQCVHCANFEQINAGDLETILSSGDVSVYFRPVSALDGNTTNQHSTRSANAAAIVADRAPESFLAFHNTLLLNRPDGAVGFSDDRIAELAADVGVPSNVTSAFTETVNSDGERLFAKWTAAATNQVRDDLAALGAQLATPAILINGERWEGNWQEPGTLYAAVLQAKLNTDAGGGEQGEDDAADGEE